MSSVYFPAHVVVLFKRLVNVVSTLSISNHYVLKSRDDNATSRTISEGVSRDSLTTTGPSYDLGRALWRQWLHRSGLQTGGATNVQTLKASLSLPNWISGWSSLLLSPELSTSGSGYHDSPPPTMPPNRTPEERPPHRISNEKKDIIHELLSNPALTDPIRTPRYPVVLCHGLYGFDSRGPSTFPSMRMHYWSNVLNVLRGLVGADVIVTSVPGTGSIYDRATKLDEQLQLRARGRGVNFLAHSMGGLDCRHLISHIQPSEYAPLSLTSISTPHRGSPFMDWCESNIGIGKLRQQEKARVDEAKAESFTLSSLPSSFTTLILSVVDSPAYANLTSNYLNEVFNPNTPDDPRVKYFSVAGRMSAESVNVWHPFWLPKMVLDGVEEKQREQLKKLWEAEGRPANGEIPLWSDERLWGNDGLVTIQSAKWGEFLGTMEGCDHWEMRGARGIEFGVDIPAIPAIGLGSLPLPSSLANFKMNGSKSAPPTNAQGDGWGFGDWTRFVGAWKKDNDAKGTAKSASSTSPNVAPTRPEGPQPRTTPTSTQTGPEDAMVKSSTDTLSVVFDWLIERVPAPGTILRRSPMEKAKGKGAESPDRENSVTATAHVEIAPRTAGSDAKELSATAVAHAVGGTANGVRVAGAVSSPPSSPPSEMKRRMEKEDKGRRQQRELARKEDLERFYIALARRMYDSGL